MGDTFSEKKVRKRNKNKIDTSADSAPQTTGKPSISFKLRLNDLWENPELLISNMAADRLRKVASSIPEYFLTKFPYVQAWTLVMLVAERALKVEKTPPMHPYLIYTVAALCFMAGVMLSARMKIQSAALLYCVVLGYLTLNAYTNKKFNYSRHERNRISGRHLGCLGIYLIYAFLKGSRQSKTLLRAGEICIALSLLGSAYIINESYEDRRALLEFVPGGNYARYFITLIFGCAGLCFLSGYFLKDISMSVGFCLMFLTFLIDIRLTYWTYRGMAYWNQMRLVIDNVNLILGFFLLSNHYENLAEDTQDEDGEESKDTDDEEENEEEDHVKSD